MHFAASKFTTLLGTVSILTLANAMTAQAQQAPQQAPQMAVAQSRQPQQAAETLLTQAQQAAPTVIAQADQAPPVAAQGGQPVAQVDEVPETVLITGSLIRGTAAVGVPVTNLAPADFAQVGAITTADLFQTVPSAVVLPGPIATSSGQYQTRSTPVFLRGDFGNRRGLLMIDGVRFPAVGKVGCHIDPSIVPQIALERIDVLVDGASATYGSDAMAGVINLILKRGFDGAVAQLQYVRGAGGMNNYTSSVLFGRTWDSGDVTLSYEWYNYTSISKPDYRWTNDFSPWGLDNRIPLASSVPGTITRGPAAPRAATLGTGCTNCFAIPVGTGVPFDPRLDGRGPQPGDPAPTLMWNGTTFVAFNGPATGTAAGYGPGAGVANEIDPYELADYSPAEQRNAMTMTFDQRLFEGVSFEGTATYSNRRSQIVNPSFLVGAENNAVSAQVPTWNPYYPTGAGVPQNLNIQLNWSQYRPSVTSAFEISGRYQGGLNFALPYNWAGKIFYALSTTQNHYETFDGVNPAALSAALGWTIVGEGPVNTIPGLATWSKPASIPYLNVSVTGRALRIVTPKRHSITFPESNFTMRRTRSTSRASMWTAPCSTSPAAWSARRWVPNIGTRICGSTRGIRGRIRCSPLTNRLRAPVPSGRCSHRSTCRSSAT